MSIVTHYNNEFSKREASFKEVPWLYEVRLAALHDWQERGFPKPHDEDWQNLRLNDFENIPFSCDQHNSTQVDAQVLESLSLGNPEEAYSLVVINGRLISSLQALHLNEKIEILPLAEAVLSRETLVKKYLTLTSENNDPFFDLNTALATDGLFIHVKSGFWLDKPLEIIFYTAGENQNRGQRHVVYVEENAGLKLVETYGGGDECYWMNTATEIVLEKNAHLELVQIQKESAKAFHTGSVLVTQKESSVFTHFLAEFGAVLSRQNIRVELTEPQAVCNIKGFYCLDAKRQADHHVRVDHLSPQCKSSTLFKGVMDDASRGIFRGLVMVHPNASKTEASQTSNSLLLTADAEADPKPQLEIYHDDVKCSHGATIGQLDEEALFYLKSRGISDEFARHLLTRAFLEELVESVDLPYVSAYLNRSLNFLMPDTAGLEGK